MNIKGILLVMVSLFGISGAFAQSIESDDMYFTSEDRAKLKSQRTSAIAYNTPSKAKKFNFENEGEERINPTDSYSARNVNPEYTSRAQTQTAQADEENYFVNNYQHNRNEYNNFNNNFNNWYSSPWYRNNYYGSAINSWNSPYYGYNSWTSPWYDPYWSYNGWSSSFAFHFGNSWNYGWGGYYNYWNRPYYGWDPYFGGLGYYGGGFGGGYWNNWRYPSTIVIVDNGERSNVVYGKRPTRGTSVVSNRANIRSRSNVNTPVREENSSGRLATQNTRQEEYYNRYNRTRSTSNSTYDSRTNTESNRARSWGNSSWDNSYNNRSTDRSSSPSYSPARSSGSSGGGTRTNTGGSTSGRRGRD